MRARMMHTRVAAREFQRGFVGFGPGVGKKNPLAECEFAEALRKQDGGFIGEHIGDMPDLAGLRRQRVDRRRMRVTD